MKNPKFVFLLVLTLLGASASFADNNAVPALKGFKVTELAPSIHMLHGEGGNILTLKGEKGLLVIDDDYSRNVQLLTSTLELMGETQFLINTHWHGDHAGGNEVLGAEAIIVAHENVRKRLSSPQSIKLFGMKTVGQQEVALPVVTYEDSLSLHFAGQHLQLKYFPAGHTDGDSVVFIKPANIVHMGDHFFNGIFPFVDVENGGSVKGMAKNVEAVLTMIDDKTIVIPGHGRVSHKAGLADFADMLKGTVEEIEQMKNSGMSLKEIQAQGLNKKWHKWSRGFINEASWIVIVFSSLSSGA